MLLEATARHRPSLGRLLVFCTAKAQHHSRALECGTRSSSNTHRMLRVLYFVGTCPVRRIVLMSVSLSPPAAAQTLHGESVCIRSHFAHAQLWGLAASPLKNRRLYEDLRAAYNSVRPAGSKAAPPFEQWRSAADLCDHPVCRCEMVSKSVKRVHSIPLAGRNSSREHQERALLSTHGYATLLFV